MSTSHIENRYLQRELSNMIDRVRELERVFGHTHEAGEENIDACQKCGLDIRDSIHTRSSQPV